MSNVRRKFGRNAGNAAFGRSTAILCAALSGTSSQAYAQAAPVQSAPSVTAQAQAQTSSSDNTPNPTPVNAPPPPSGLEDIIVTAQKRSENVQNVPITIQAFSGAALRDSGVNSVQDLTKLVPTYKFGSAPGTVAARNSIRGLGAFGNSAIEPSVATYLDGVYVPRAGSLNSTLVDVQSLEVLSGPQGTLFGRNASVGAISITTALPTNKLEGSAAFEAGTGERYRGEVVANLPFNDKFAIRFAGLGEKFGGYWHQDPTGRRFGGIDTISLRLTARYQFNPNLSWIVRTDYSTQTGDAWYNISIIPSSVTPTILTNLTRVLRGNLPTIGIDSNSSKQDVSTARIDDYHFGVSSTLNFSTDSGFEFKLINSYRHWRASEQDGEVTFLPVPLLYRHFDYESKSQNHEFQVVSPKDRLLGGRLNFVAGLYFFQEAFHLDQDYNLRGSYCTLAVANFAPPLVPACLAGPQMSAFYQRYPQETTSYAGYGQATLEVLPKVDLTVGGRYTHEHKDATFFSARVNPAAVFGTNENSPLNYSDGRFTGRANLDWKPTRDILLFATYSTGFKAGGFNSGASNIALGNLRDYGPETVKNYEVGFKTQFFHRALTANVTAYRMDVNGFQERALTSVASLIRNVGSIRSQGVDAQFAAAPTSWFRINAAVAYNDNKFRDYQNAPPLPWQTGVQNLTGTRPTYSPVWSTSEGIEFRNEFANGFRAALRADVSSNSAQNLNAVIDNSPITVQKAYALLSARLSIFSPGDRYSLAVFGSNLTDHHYCVNEGYLPFGPQLGALDVPGKSEAVTCFHGNPRTIGVRVGAKF
ncbi:TonB-dependent receptor [Sphingomonas sp. TREG-RG-20F-R18-01]|uniref:TonB-dependent receptor n=1 Tax=Sphingomonas sp. TREG-RG-20F-R18-01 TaxID=2914982 RepID=UPI001F573393|nr:TonB-dependent receptor [Sphingomonas sp. TREG-RG-20F-R18-01]